MLYRMTLYDKGTRPNLLECIFPLRRRLVLDAAWSLLTIGLHEMPAGEFVYSRNGISLLIHVLVASRWLKPRHLKLRHLGGTSESHQ